MTVLASLLISRRVVRPIAMLRQGADRIGAGELNHRIDVRTGDELEALAGEFNRMAVHLQASHASLEQQVEARTRELAQAVAELQALGEVGRAVSSTLDLETVLSTIITPAVQLSGAHGGVLYEYDEATQTFHLRATHETKQELVDALQAAPIRLGEGAVGSAAARRAPVPVPDFLDEQAVVLPRVRMLLVQFGYRSLLAVPLLLDKQIFGGLVVYRSEPGQFPAPSVQLLQTFATQSILALQNARHFQEIAAWNRTLEQRVSEQLTALEGMDRMKRFFSPHLAELLVSSGNERLLQSHRREVTVVFCDLRGFTAFADLGEGRLRLGLRLHRLLDQHNPQAARHSGPCGLIPLGEADAEDKLLRLAIPQRQQTVPQGYDLWRGSPRFRQRPDPDGMGTLCSARLSTMQHTAH
jgi:adenylate cyclase